MSKKTRHWLLGDWRVFLCGLLLVGGLAVVLWRCFSLQILGHDKYAEQADLEQMRQWVIPARRGQIYAFESGAVVPLVLNETVYEVFVDPLLIEQAGNASRVRAALEAVPAEPRQEIAAALGRTKTQYQVIFRNLSRAEAEKLKAANLSGVGLREMTRRVYPEEGLAAQTLGFVNGEGLGQYGIEGALEAELRGRDGLLRAVTDVNNVPLSVDRARVRTPAENGADVVLTLDRAIQLEAERVVAAGAERAQAEYANLLVMNPWNGQILAMANYPSFSPTDYAEARLEDFQNPILTDAYEAGSVIKTFIMATALERGAARASDTYENVYTRQIDGWPVSSFQAYRVGEQITYQEAMDNSLNTGMISLLERLGGGELNAAGRGVLHDFYTQRFKLGQRMELPLPNTAGQLMGPAELPGVNVQYATMTFGQGMTTTMLQVAAGFSAVVNGGEYITPQLLAGRLVEGQLVPTEAPARERVLSESTSTEMRAVLEHIRDFAYGFNQNAWFLDPLTGYNVGGKTGTAQIPNPAGGYYPGWAIGSYVGYAGGERPEVVVMARVGGDNYYRAADASWMFNEITPWLMDYLQITEVE